MKLSIYCPFMRFKSREDAQVEILENVRNNNSGSPVIVVARLIILIWANVVSGHHSLVQFIIYPDAVCLHTAKLFYLLINL
jgi:hypothetical protein